MGKPPASQPKERLPTMSEILTIDLGADGSFDCYVARPAGDAPAPVVVVIQEIFGVNEGIRGKCRWLADAGFIAVAPDLFWRLQPGVQLTDKTKEEWEKAFDLMNRFDIDRGIRDLQTVTNEVRDMRGANGRVGNMGYCLGGRLAYLMAARTDTDASAGYYGVGLDQLLGEAIHIKKPLMLHIAELDKFSTPEKRDAVVEGLQDNPLVTTHVYAGTDHAFSRVGGDHYDAAAAGLADDRAVSFFKQHLQA